MWHIIGKPSERFFFTNFSSRTPDFLSPTAVGQFWRLFEIESFYHHRSFLLLRGPLINKCYNIWKFQWQGKILYLGGVVVWTLGRNFLNFACTSPNISLERYLIIISNYTPPCLWNISLHLSNRFSQKRKIQDNAPTKEKKINISISVILKVLRS